MDDGKWNLKMKQNKRKKDKNIKAIGDNKEKQKKEE